MKETYTCFAVIPPDEKDLIEFKLRDSIGNSKTEAWLNFCYPALKREGFEADGFKAEKVKITIETI